MRNWPKRAVFALKGRRTKAQCRPAKQRRELSKKAAGKAKLSPKKLKVRNYNVKDDPRGWPVIFVCTRPGRSVTKKFTASVEEGST